MSFGRAPCRGLEAWPVAAHGTRRSPKAGEDGAWGGAVAGTPEARWGHTLPLVPVLRPTGPPSWEESRAASEGGCPEPRQRAAHEDQWAQLQEPGECEMPGGLPSPCAPNPDLPPRLWASRKVRGGRSGQLPGQVPPDAFRAPAGPAFRTPAGPAATTDTGGDRSSLCIAMLSSACHLHPPPDTPPP